MDPLRDRQSKSLGMHQSTAEM